MTITSLSEAPGTVAVRRFPPNFCKLKTTTIRCCGDEEDKKAEKDICIAKHEKYI